jgi:hypothetical protein
LDKGFLHLLDLVVLFWPGIRTGCDINRVYVVVIVYQNVDGILSQLEGHLMLGDHVDMDDICLNRGQSVVGDGF